MGIFSCKKLNQVLEDCKGVVLKKTLGTSDLILLGLGSIIGSGVFVLTGLAAAQYAGPSIVISFLLGGIAAVFTGLSYAELATLLPASGNAYTYAYVAIGECVASLIGWTVFMINFFGGSAVAVSWSGYMCGIFESIGLPLPYDLCHGAFEGGIINLPAVLITLIITGLLIRGTQEAARLNNILVVVKVAVIFIFVAVSVPNIHPVNWEVFAPNGFFGITAGAGFIFMAFNGFDVLASAAEECKNPNRDLPLGIVGSILISALLYIVVSGLLTAIVHYSQLGNAEPMAFALRQNGMGFAAKIVAFGAIAGMTTVLLSQVYVNSRTLMVMARDGLMPKFFSMIHPRFSTPYIGILTNGILIAITAGFFPVVALGQLCCMSALAVFSVVSICVLIMRYKAPQEPRIFKCPAVYWVASISTLLCSFLFFQLFFENWKPYMAATTVGLLIYIFYGYYHSVLRNHCTTDN